MTWAQAAASKSGTLPAKECRRLIIRITSTKWQQPALAENRRRLPPDILTAPVSRAVNGGASDVLAVFYLHIDLDYHKVGFSEITR